MAIPILYQRYTNAMMPPKSLRSPSALPPYFLRISSVMTPTTYGDGMESIGRR